MITKKLPLLLVMLLLTQSVEAASIDYESAKLLDEQRLQIQTSDKKITFAEFDATRIDEGSHVGFSKPKISKRKNMVGWLALYSNGYASYPRELVIQQNGRIVSRIRGNNLPIWQWAFSAAGAQVAIRQSPTHGDLPDHFELRDIASGKLVDQFDSEKYGSMKGAPDWALGLE